MPDVVAPQPPPGFTLVDGGGPQEPSPVPPPGFTVQDPSENAPAPPAGFTLEGEDRSVPFGSVMRGLVQTRQGMNALGYMLGIVDDNDFVNATVDAQASLLKYPKPPSQQAFERESVDQGAFSALLDHPMAIPSMITEGLPAMIASIPTTIAGGVAGGVVAGPPGATAGASLGVGVGAAATEYGNQLLNYLTQKGVDISNPQALGVALQDKNLMNEAHWYAAKKAGVSGVFNTIGAQLGGKLTMRFFTPETKLLSTEGAKGVAALGGVAAGTTAATEVGQDIATGEEIDPGRIAVDSFIGGLSNLVPMAAPGIAERLARGKGKVRSEKDVGVDGNPIKDSGETLPTDKDAANTTLDTQAPDAAPIFKQAELDSLRALSEIVDQGPERATPSDWINFLNKKKPGETLDAASFVRKSGFDAEEPISRDEIRRMVDERQLVVQEDGPATPKPDMLSEDGEPIMTQVLNVAHESPVEAPPQVEGQPSPVVESTVSKLTPVAQVAVEEHRDTQGRPVLVVTKVTKPEGDVPFKSNWDETVVQRVNRFAAENGYEAVSWPQTKPDVQVEGPLSSEAPVSRGDDVTSVKRVGEDAGAERVTVKVRDANKRTMRLRGWETKNFALNSALPGEGIPKNEKINFSITHSVAPSAKSHVGQVEAVNRAVMVLRELEPKFNLQFPVDVEVHVGVSARAYGDYQFMPTGRHRIRIHVDVARDPTVIYTTMWHEFGHALARDKWGSAHHTHQQAIMDAYHEWLNQQTARSPTGTLRGAIYNDFELNRLNAVLATDWGLPDPKGNFPIGNSSSFDYMTSFAEFFAEQVARWATVSEKPLSVTDKFFAAVANKIRFLVSEFRKRFPGSAPDPHQAIHDWMESFVRDVRPNWSVSWFAQQAKSVIANIRALRKGGLNYVPGTPVTTSTVYQRTMLQRIFGRPGNLPGNSMAAAAVADRFSRMSNLMLSLPQVAKLNKDITELQMYNETIRIMANDRAKMADRAVSTLKPWRRIGKPQTIALNKVIDDYMNMRYLTSQERARGVQRLPTQQELDALYQKHGVTPSTVALFDKIRTDFIYMLDRYGDNLMNAAQRMTDPLASALRMREIAVSLGKMKSKPYFPAMRFGDYTLTIRDAKGRVVHFETFETERQRNAAREMAEGVYPSSVFDHAMGVLPEDVKPLLGMPPGLLDRVKDTLSLSKTQEKMMEELRFELAPGQSFKHRFQKKDLTSGYSEDFMRAYANYMFHGSSYIARTKYVEDLETFIKAVRIQSEFMPDGTKRGMIANFMSQHLADIIDAKSDFVKLKGMIFHWALGFNPKAAALNLSQQYISTLPFLGSKFGDVAALAEMTKAQTSLSTMYKEATLKTQTDLMSRALVEGIRDGSLTEAMAPELAGISEGRNMGRYLGGHRMEKLWYDFSKLSAMMFQATEAWNRRVTFRAAFNLAMRDPAHKHVVETVNQNQIRYGELRNQGWNHREASAYVTATDAVRTTQYEYAAYARPRIFSGKKGALFIFKSFVQNTLFMLWNNPGTAARSLLVMGFLGGAMGLPGMEDLSGILKAVAWKLFGKDFDLEREAREFANSVTDGSIDPGLMLHGISREGFGFPAALDYLGESVGLGDVPFPTVDESGSIGLGQISPVDFGAMFGPTRDQNSAALQATQQAAGAAFGMTFAMYKSLTDTQHSWNDPMRWMRVMPAAARNVTKAYQAYSSGVLRTANGTPIQTFDVNDTEQMAEAIAMGLGYTPLSVSSQYDRMGAMAEIKTYWQVRHDILLHQATAAYQSGDREEFERQKQAIKNFNRMLPRELRAFAVTPEGLTQSIKANVKGDAAAMQNRVTNVRDAGVKMIVDETYPVMEVGRRTVR